MAIGTPTLIISPGNVFNSGSPSSATAVDAPQNSLVVVSIATTPPDSVVALVDSVGNNYTQAGFSTDGLTNQEMWYCSNIIHIPVGSTFIASLNANAGQWYFIGAAATAGATGLDETLVATGSGTTSVTMLLGPLREPNEVLFGTINFGAITSYTESAGFTSLTIATTNDAFAYQIVNSAATTVTYNPSWSPNSRYEAVLASFALAPVMIFNQLATANYTAIVNVGVTVT